MPPEIVVVDYGAGNLRSVYRALEKAGASPKVTDDPADLRHAAGIVLPGVGSSGSAMAALEARGLVEPLREAVASGIPFFGVCLGLQLLLDFSEEDPHPCLGAVPGRVCRFVTGLKVPHMGWNQVELTREHVLFQGVPSGSSFYFVHSYYAQPDDPTVVLGRTEYDVTFCSAVAAGSLVATQFHPEKSGPAGLRLYENFLRHMVRERAVKLVR